MNSNAVFIAVMKAALTASNAAEFANDLACIRCLLRLPLLLVLPTVTVVDTVLTQAVQSVPPQSVPVSSPFITPSVQVGQAGQSPPQSTPVSAPFCIPSIHVLVAKAIEAAVVVVVVVGFIKLSN